MEDTTTFAFGPAKLSIKSFSFVVVAITVSAFLRIFFSACNRVVSFLPVPLYLAIPNEWEV